MMASSFFPSRTLRELPLVLRGAFFEWNEDKVPRMAAAIAFYAVFSLTPIVVIAFKIAERSFGTEVALREILAQAAFLIGNEGAAAIETLISNAQPRAATPLATGLGRRGRGSGSAAFLVGGAPLPLERQPRLR